MILQLFKTIQPQNSLVSLELAKKHAMIDHDYDDFLIQAWIDASEEYVESYLDRSLQVSTYTLTISHQDNTHPIVHGGYMNPVFFNSSWGYHRNHHHVELLRSPLQNVQSVSTICEDGTERLLTLGDDYYVSMHLDPARITLKTHVDYNCGEYLKVVYQAGYGSGQVPKSIIPAILLRVSHLNEHRTDDFEFPRAINSLLDPHRLVRFA